MSHLAIIAILAILVAVLFARNEVVYRVRKRRGEEIAAEAAKRIKARDYDGWEVLYDDFRKRSYNAMMLDLRCWTYKQFYPNEVA